MKKDRENFFADVYEVVRMVPAGRVTSYGAIAQYLGLRAGARMVGWAMNHSHSVPNVPAHRVVNRIGMLTGKHHFQTPETMQNLLEAEGVAIKNDRVANFKKLFWDPSESLVL